MKLLVSEDGEKLLVEEEKLEGDLHTHWGVIDRSRLLKARIGSKVKTHLGKEFIVLPISFPDALEALHRVPQIVLLKDAALIAAYTGVCSGHRVLDAGVGSGALTCFLAHLVKPEGKVYGYEIREDFLKIAEENVKMFKLEKWVELRLKNIYEGIDEKELDLITLDLPEPWRAIKHAEEALKLGGFLVSYLPTTTQVQLLCNELEKSKLKAFKICEAIEREWIVKGRVVRPATRMLGHTAFLVFARKMKC